MKATIRKIDAAASVRARGAALPPAGATLQLGHGRGASLAGILGWQVRALRGQIWITVDGDIRDIVLQPGQDFVFDRAGPALLWSLDGEDATLALRPRDTAPQQRVSSPVNAGHPVFA